MRRPSACSRYNAMGEPCKNATEHLDGWCREPGCDGFVRSTPASAPFTHSNRVSFHKTGEGSQRASTDESSSGVIQQNRRVAFRATDLYKAHHGGSTADAVGALVMIADRCERGDWDALKRRSGEFTVFSGDGYSITIAPNGAIVGYAAVHRDRTWHQVRAGIRSRVSKKRTKASNVHRSTTASGVALADALARWELGDVFTGKVVSIVNFGCFIEVDGVNGLLHRSELVDLETWPQVGEDIRVAVTRVDLEMLRVAFRPAAE